MSPNFQEKGYAFGQAVQLVGSGFGVLAWKDAEKRELFIESVCAAYGAILEARQRVRESEAGE